MMHENIPARRTLDKAITLRVVEPLNFPNFFFHGNLAPSVFGFDSVFVLFGGLANQGMPRTYGSAAVALELRPYRPHNKQVRARILLSQQSLCQTLTSGSLRLET